MTPSQTAEALDLVMAGVEKAIVELRDAARQRDGFATSAGHFIRTFERGLSRLQSDTKKPRAGRRTGTTRS
jgi:hypothetical protein